MIKTKLAKIKKKMQENPELTTLFATATVLITATTVGSIWILKTVRFEIPEDDGFRLEEITGDAREKMMSDTNFALLKVTEDEYMYCRQTDA